MNAEIVLETRCIYEKEKQIRGKGDVQRIRICAKKEKGSIILVHKAQHFRMLVVIYKLSKKESLKAIDR